MSLDWPLCIAPRYECVHEWCPELLRYAIYTLCYAIHIYIYMVGERVVHFIYIYTLRTIHAATLHIHQPFLLCLLSVLST